ncbi:BCCT family transporter [Staphylococcus aureus]
MVMSHLVKQVINQNLIHLHGRQCCCFCAGIGSDILYWGVIEWAFYYQVPPNGAKSMSDEALQYATQYGMFHWGPIAWAIYVYGIYQLVI